MTGNIVVYYEKVNGSYIESGFVIKSTDIIWHVADFRTEGQLQEFADLLGFTYEWDEVSPGRKIGHCSHVIEHESIDEDVRDEFMRMSRTAYWGVDSDESAAAMEWLDRIFDTERGAYKINDVNLGRSKKIKALSNGSVVDCLFVNDGETIRIYRCNPNARMFYKPMPMDERMEYQRIHGVY